MTAIASNVGSQPAGREIAAVDMRLSDDDGRTHAVRDIFRRAEEVHRKW